MSDINRPESGGIVRRRGRDPEIPIGFRPAPSDDELETTALERWQGWGMLLTVFLGLLLAAYWLFFEPARATEAALKQRHDSITRGAEHFAKGDERNTKGYDCAQCHGSDAGGGKVASFTAPGTTVPVLNLDAPNLRLVFKRQIVDAKKTPKDAYRFVYQTIAQGRPGTPMPTWGLAYGGPLNDQQLDDIVNFLISVQDGLPKDVKDKLALGAARGPFSRLIAYGATAG